VSRSRTPVRNDPAPDDPRLADEERYRCLRFRIIAAARRRWSS